MRTRLLLSAAASGALTLGCVLTAPAALAVPTTPACVDAQTQLNTDRGHLQTARNQLASDRAVGATNTQIAIDNAAISQASAVVSQDQAVVNIQCGTTTGTGTGNGFPRPRPRPVPAPIGLPNGGYLNCTQLAARGLHDIPAGNPFYRTALDTNRDGVACETTTTVPVGTYRIVNGKNCKWDGTTWIPVTPPPAPVTIDAPCNCTPTTDPQPAPVILQQPAVTQTVVEPAPVVIPPAPSGSNYSQIGQAPAGYANTGFGPNA